MGSYYAAETFLKAAPTRDQKLNMLCNTTVQLQQWKTNRDSSTLQCITDPVLFVLCHGQLLVAGISWPLPVFKGNMLTKPTNNPARDNPTAKVHHSYSQHIIHVGCPANSCSCLPFNVQFYPRTKGTFWSYRLCQFFIFFKTLYMGKWSQCGGTFHIRITALKCFKSFFESMTSTKLHFGLLSAENIKSRNIYF